MLEDLSTNVVISNIYEAAYNPMFWPTALEGISEITCSSSAELIYEDDELDLTGRMHFFNSTYNHSARYNSLEINPNFVTTNQNIPVGVAVDHIIPDCYDLTQAHGNELLHKPATNNHCNICGAILFNDEIYTAVIVLKQIKPLCIWRKHQLDTLNNLIPHIQHAINLQKKVIHLQTNNQALCKSLNKLLMGLILFDKKLQPIYINSVAKSILNYHPAIEIKNKNIYAFNSLDTKKIHHALITAISSKMDTDTTESCTALGLKHPDCNTILPILISPIQGFLHGIKTNGRFVYAVMCFSDPDRSHLIEPDELEDIYELTPAEAQVAIYIANSMSPCEIARINDVSINTIRAQIKTIYKKLDVNHQTELINILITSPLVRS